MGISGQSSQQRVMRDYATLVRELESHFDGQVRLDVNNEENDLKFMYFMVKPKDGPYHGGRFYFTMHIHETYPTEAPIVYCETKIYHPNIDPEVECDAYTVSNICIDLLDQGVWETHNNLIDAIQAVLYLFYNPNLEDAYSPYFSGTDEDDFYENVRLSLEGEMIDDWVQFPRNLDESYDIEDFLEEVRVREEDYKYHDDEDDDEEEKPPKVDDVIIEDWESKAENVDSQINDVMTRNKNDVNKESEDANEGDKTDDSVNQEQNIDDVDGGEVTETEKKDVVDGNDVTQTEKNDVVDGNDVIQTEKKDVVDDNADVVELGSTFMSQDVETDNLMGDTTDIINESEKNVISTNNIVRNDSYFSKLWTRLLEKMGRITHNLCVLCGTRRQIQEQYLEL